jgi:hypothetical protein
MSTSIHREDVAVVCDRDAKHASRMETYLRAGGITGAQWYAPSDADDADKALRAGLVRRIVFVRMDDFLTALFEGLLAPQHWPGPDMPIELAEPPGPAGQAWLAAIVSSWSNWRRRRRFRQAVAGLVLSAAALLAAFCLLLLAS